jgi:hypothetical protein
LAGIDSLEAANHFLEMRFLPEWEQRFTVAPRNARNAHRRLGQDQHLEEILSVRVARRVAQDHTVSWDGKRWGVLREDVCAGLRGAAVRSNGGWTEATGCATAGAICTCARVQKPRERPQVLPAYGLQDLRNKHQDPKTKSHPNTTYLQNTLYSQRRAIIGSTREARRAGRTAATSVTKPSSNVAVDSISGSHGVTPKS